MSNLVLSTPEIIIFKGRPMVSSLQVARHFGKRHDDVLKKIRQLEIPENFRLRNFAESSYVNQQGKKQPMYLMTRDGFALLVMGFTGKRAMEWKIRYIEAFNAMERKLKEEFQRKLLLEQEEFKNKLLKIVEKQVEEKVEQIVNRKIQESVAQKTSLPVKVIEYRGQKFRFFVTDNQLCLYAKDLAVLLGAEKNGSTSYVAFLKNKGFIPKKDLKSEYVSFVAYEYGITTKEFLKKLELPATSVRFFCYITFSGFTRIKQLVPEFFDLIIKKVFPHFPEMYRNYNSCEQNL